MQVTPNSQSESAAASDEAAAPAVVTGDQRSLVKNTAYLFLAQVATVPLSIAAAALIGRYLGPEMMGYTYVGGTACGFAVLLLEWGHQGALPALVARDRPGAPAYLGTSLSWRFTMSLLLAIGLAIYCEVMGYGSMQKWVVALMFPASLLASCGGAIKDTIRGFERTDIPALAQVGQQVLVVCAMLPILLLGGSLKSVLLSSLTVAAVTLISLRLALRGLGLKQLRFERSALKQLLILGTPFVFFDFAMAILPIINASFLSKLVPTEVIGWYSVSQRLIGFIIFPASALIGALYPTLCRLHLEDQPEFVRVTREALANVALIAVPAALGCGLFPELGVMIFGSVKFAGAMSHLRVMSLFVFLVYFTMPLGSAILACNRQRAWALVQSSCILVSVVGSPLLVPYFQKQTGNGALGTCITLIASEAFVVTCGLVLAPRGIVNAELVKSLLLAALSGVGMAVVAWFTKPFSLFLAVPAALATYAVVAYFTGAIKPRTVDMLKGFVQRKLRRR